MHRRDSLPRSAIPSSVRAGHEQHRRTSTRTQDRTAGSERPGEVRTGTWRMRRRQGAAYSCTLVEQPSTVKHTPVGRRASSCLKAMRTYHALKILLWLRGVAGVGTLCQASGLPQLWVQEVRPSTKHRRSAATRPPHSVTVGPAVDDHGFLSRSRSVAENLSVSSGGAQATSGMNRRRQNGKGHRSWHRQAGDVLPAARLGAPDPEKQEERAHRRLSPPPWPHRP